MSFEKEQYMSRALSSAVDTFCEFTRYTPPRKIDQRNFDCLAEYIRLWFLHDSVAMLDCGGDYKIWLLVVIAIIDRWCDKPEILDFAGDNQEPPQKRRVNKLFSEKFSGMSFRIVDEPMFYAVKANPDVWKEYGDTLYPD